MEGESLDLFLCKIVRWWVPAFSMFVNGLTLYLTYCWAISKRVINIASATVWIFAKEGGSFLIICPDEGFFVLPPLDSKQNDLKVYDPTTLYALFMRIAPPTSVKKHPR